MQDKPTIYYLDLTGCTTWWDFHQRIKESLDFPDYYGRNWDAFWDVIRGFDTSLIKITGADKVAPNLKDYVTKMLEIMERAKRKYHLLDYMVIDENGNTISEIPDL